MELDSNLPFLGIFVHLPPTGTLEIFVHRNPIHYGVIHHFQSQSTISHKGGCVKILISHLHSRFSIPVAQKAEKADIYKVLANTSSKQLVT